MYRWADGHMDGQIGHAHTQTDGHTYNFIILIVLLRFVTAFAALRRCKKTHGVIKNVIKFTFGFVKFSKMQPSIDHQL
jgi:hypothetical protein